MTPLLAHQGGWDEILMLVGAALLVVGFLRWSERRARQRVEEGEEDERGDPSSEERDPHPNPPPQAGEGEDPGDSGCSP